jgi:hypothetical protein
MSRAEMVVLRLAVLILGPRAPACHAFKLQGPLWRLAATLDPAAVYLEVLQGTSQSKGSSRHQKSVSCSGQRIPWKVEGQGMSDVRG